MDIKIHRTENLYFALKVIFTMLVVLAVGGLYVPRISFGGARSSTFVVFFVYALSIWLFVMFQKIFLVAYMKGNGVTVTEKQFADFYALYKEMAEKLGIRKLPKLFILQQGGLLNAFAIRFSGRNYIAIYSDVFNLIASDPDAVRFVVGHELGHVARKHMSKRFWTFPSSLVPFLTPAYSRSCEYTCDNIGGALAGGAYEKGLLVLAAGTELYKRINVEGYMEDAAENNSAAVRFAALFMSHPYIPKRLRNLRSA